MLFFEGFNSYKIVYSQRAHHSRFGGLADPNIEKFVASVAYAKAPVFSRFNAYRSLLMVYEHRDFISPTVDCERATPITRGDELLCRVDAIKPFDITLVFTGLGIWSNAARDAEAIMIIACV